MDDGDGDAVHDDDAHAAVTTTASSDEDASNNSNSISWRAHRQSTVPAAVAACLVAAVAVGSSGALLRYQRGVVRLSWEPIIEQRDGCELTRAPMRALLCVPRRYQLSFTRAAC
eukprot:COSAG01_NODE_3186_length_6441_cov_145.702460_10_plen_114_part_00